jgi:hypothetical protein
MSEQQLSEQSGGQWFEVQVVLKIRAADDGDAINRAAAVLRLGYQSVGGMHPVGNFDAWPCASPLMKERRL